MNRILIALALAATLGQAASGTDNITTNRTPAMKLRLSVNTKVLTATLADNKTVRDFISLLPLTLTMNDLFGREKYARLPRAISQEGNERTLTKLETWLIGLPLTT